MGDGRFQILALNGGGARALFTAHILAGLEDDLDTSVTQHFDLIVGTSAGGIIALGLGAGIEPAELVERFTALNRRVFPPRRRRHPRRLFRPAYSPAPLRAALEQVLGTHTLADSTKRLVVPAYDVGRGGVHVFKTPHHTRLRADWKVPMVEVALATSAAPTFFPAADVTSMRLVDGGVWANNPSVIGIAEAVSMLGAELGQIRLLNVGTTSPVTHHSRRLDRGGLLTWASRAAQVVLDATSKGTSGTAEHLLGRGNYVCFDGVVPGGLFALDRVNEQDIAGLARSVSRQLSETFDKTFKDHTAAPYTPLYPTSQTPEVAP